MAEVWLGTDLSLTRQVAVKLLKPMLAADPVVAERFRREAIAVAQLSHPNIVAVYDAIEEQIGGERRQAVVMQLVNGKSLRQLLDEQKRLSPDLTIHIGACVAAALDCAHHANLVHRDVKPGNILITPDGRVLLTDFGIAKGLAGTTDDDLTSPNVMMGTAKYLSPEQVRGRRLDGRADLYSLGLVLYECLAGRVPFLGETDADTALARLNRDPTDLARLRPTLPLGLAPLIHRLLARKPDDRYTSGADVKTELQRIAAQPKIDHDLSRDVTRGTPQRGTPQRGTPAAAATASTRTSSSTSTTAPGPRRSSPVNQTRQPTPVSGYQPVRTGRAVAPPTRVDRTPPSPTRPRQQPNRKYEQRSGPSSMVVAGLLIAALVVGLVLWVTMGTDDSSGLAVPTTQPAADTTLAATPQAAVGIVAVHSFDPDGDGEEHDDQIPLVTDDNVSTAWTTVCYSDRYLGGKRGVGLVADLGSARTGVLTIVIGSAPYQLSVFAAGDGPVPTAFPDWGSSVRSFHGVAAETVTVQVDTPARYLFVSFNELGTNNDCANNPYRGSIQELTFT